MVSKVIEMVNCGAEATSVNVNQATAKEIESEDPNVLPRDQ